jgi:hypothetical protein
MGELDRQDVVSLLAVIGPSGDERVPLRVRGDGVNRFVVV